MPAVQSGRFNLFTWPSNSDEFSRSQMDESHRNIETFGAVFRQDAFGNRGSASTWTRSFFYDTTNAILYFSDGTSWKKITDLASSTASMVAVSPSTPTADAGTSDQAARIDHRHATPAWGTSIQSTHTSNTAGSTAEFARVDHRHAIGAGSVGAGALAVNAISNSNMFTSRVVDSNAIGLTAVAKANIAADQQIPAGVIMAYVGSTAPTGWLLCNGQSVLKSAYPDLWTVLSGQNYGSTTTNFTVPDLRDRMPRGAANTTDSLGLINGSDTVTIGASNLPNHTHSATGITVDPHPSHTHLLQGTGATTTTNNAPHVHFIPAQNTVGQLNNGTVLANNTYNALFWGSSIPGHPNNEPAGTLKPNYFSGGGYEYPAGWTAGYVADRSVTTLNPARFTDGAADGAPHSHTLSGSTQGPSATLSHTVDGTTGNPTGTVGQQMTVLPKTQTVNYIIKT